MDVYCVFRIEQDEQILECIFSDEKSALEYKRKGEFMTFDNLVCEKWNVK